MSVSFCVVVVEYCIEVSFIQLDLHLQQVFHSKVVFKLETSYP
jgi:hypothetical protein